MQTNRLVWRLSLQIAQCMQMSWNIDFTVDWPILCSPCIICFLGFVFFSHPWCHSGYTFPPCVRCNTQQVGHEQQVAAEENLSFWEPLGDHRSRRSMKCRQGLKCNREPRSSWAAQRETDRLVQSFDLAPLHRSSDWMTPAKKRKLYLGPTYKVSLPHVKPQRSVGWNFGPPAAPLLRSLRQLLWQCKNLCLSSDQLFEG